MIKCNLGRNEFISLYELYSTSLRDTQARTQARVEVATMEGCCLLACSQAHIQLLFLQSPSLLTCLISLTVTWILLQQLTIKKCPTCLPTSQSDKENSSAEAPSSQACQVDNQGWPSQSFISLCLSLHINILPPSINFLYIRTHIPSVVPAFCSVCFICNNWLRSILIPPKAFTYLFYFFKWRYFHTIYSYQNCPPSFPSRSSPPPPDTLKNSNLTFLIVCTYACEWVRTYESNYLWMVEVSIPLELESQAVVRHLKQVGTKCGSLGREAGTLNRWANSPAL